MFIFYDGKFKIDKSFRIDNIDSQREFFCCPTFIFTSVKSNEIEGVFFVPVPRSQDKNKNVSMEWNAELFIY